MKLKILLTGQKLLTLEVNHKAILALVLLFSQSAS